MQVTEKGSNPDIHPVVKAAPLTCCSCGRELKSPRHRVRNECEAYCRTCYARLMFPDVRETDTESLD